MLQKHKILPKKYFWSGFWCKYLSLLEIRQNKITAFSKIYGLVLILTEKVVVSLGDYFTYDIKHL